MSVYKDAKEVKQDEDAYIEVTIDGVSSVVPKDVNNRHYSEMMEQVADGKLTIADSE